MSQRLREWRLSRARAARTEKPAAPLDPAEKFAKEAHDLDALRKTVEDASAVSAGFWLSYLFVLFYIAIAAGAVTHRDLLLENPVKLPFLNVELPLVAFFVLAPILFIVSHAYTLVHFVVLGAKVGVFDTELRAQLGDAQETREGLRRQLPSNIFVQFLAGPGDIRKGGLGLILKAIAWTSLVIGPVLLLLLIQAQFLPYHLEWVTWVQRVAIVVDVILLWLLWPAVLNGRSRLMWRLERRSERWPGVLALTGRYIVGLTASLVPIGLAFTAATFPGEWMEEWVGNKQWIPPNGVTAWLGAKDEHGKPISTSFHDLLFNGEVDDVTGRRNSLFSNTLVLPEFDALEAAKIDDLKKLDTVKHTLILRRRHLESAVFSDADLRKADLEGAQLQGASIGDARGASLNSAQLQGASLNFAQLQGAVLKWANLQGASLDGAQLQGASLDNADLQGVSLNFAELQGAVLKWANLQGTSLHGTQLQGASLDNAQLQSASLAGAYLWRASLDNISFDAIAGWGLVWGQSAQAAGELPTGHRWTKMTFLALKKKIGEDVPAGSARDEALERLEILDPGKPFEAKHNVPDWRKKIEDAEKATTIEPMKYEEALAAELKALICSGDADAVYVARGLLKSGIPILNSGAQAPSLAHAVLGKECPVSTTLTESYKTLLRQLSAYEMRSLICKDDNNALNILRGFLTDGYIKETGDQAPGLVDAILKPECPVFPALTEADKAALKKIAKEASGTH